MRGDLTPHDRRLPALPAGLRELFLDCRPRKPPAESDGGLDNGPRNLDVRHMTALTRLTLVGMTTALLSEELLGSPPGLNPPRVHLSAIASMRALACADSGATGRQPAAACEA